MIQSCAEILGKLCIYERDYLRYTKCLSRGIEVQLSARPEELVRQVLLYFLLKESGLYPTTVDVRTEHNNLDVALYKPYVEEQLHPHQSPLAIIEVKREEAILADHEDQLEGYLKERRTTHGVLFNANAIVHCEKKPDGGLCKLSLQSLTELGDLLRSLVLQTDLDLSTFHRAREGDVGGFVYLVEKYGKYAVHRITFSLKNRPEPITGCFFSVDGQRIQYDVYGKYTKKKFAFDRGEFDRLHSVIYEMRS
jgi:hypothetical protein